MTGGEEGDEEGVEMSEKFGEVWWYREKVFQDDVLSLCQSCM